MCSKNSWNLSWRNWFMQQLKVIRFLLSWLFESLKEILETFLKRQILLQSIYWRRLARKWQSRLWYSLTNLARRWAMCQFELSRCRISIARSRNWSHSIESTHLQYLIERKNSCRKRRASRSTFLRIACVQRDCFLSIRLDLERVWQDRIEFL